MIIDVIAGARPNFMKIAPIIGEIRSRRTNGGTIRFRLVHTGQHYDARMSRDFFDQLMIPYPDINLKVGSGSHAEQTSSIMLGYEKLLLKEPVGLCLVVGDVTSTMACAIVAKKLCIPVAHVEAGIRSGDLSMPEEINRIVTDSITDWFFTTSKFANDNLRKSGIDNSRIFFVGNTMIDTLLLNMKRFSQPKLFGDLGLECKKYLVVTLHRPNNVDNSKNFYKLLTSISEISRGLPIIFPIHPRTAKSLSKLNKIPSNVHMVHPQPYLQFNWLVKNSFAVITDSGGVTEETTFMGIPCLTIRDNTERPETVTIGTNQIIGSDAKGLTKAFDGLFLNSWKKGKIPPLWDGKASQRIVTALESILLE